MKRQKQAQRLAEERAKPRRSSEGPEPTRGDREKAARQSSGAASSSPPASAANERTRGTGSTEAAGSPAVPGSATQATSTKPQASGSSEIVPAATGGDAASQAAALQAFVQANPTFLRVLQNPKKCLGDPRVKSMFMREVQKYPAVKAFLEAKGLSLT